MDSQPEETESTICLHRIQEISQTFPSTVWNYCPTGDNPVDLLMRETGSEGISDSLTRLLQVTAYLFIMPSIPILILWVQEINNALARWIHNCQQGQECMLILLIAVN